MLLARAVGENDRVTADLDRPLDRVDAVLLALDGTLVDSAPGILGSLTEAFAEVGLPLPEGGLPHTLLGPPLYVSLPSLVGDDVAPELLATYRRIYAEQPKAFDRRLKRILQSPAEPS